MRARRVGGGGAGSEESVCARSSVWAAVPLGLAAIFVRVWVLRWMGECLGGRKAHFQPSWLFHLGKAGRSCGPNAVDEVNWRAAEVGFPGEKDRTIVRFMCEIEYAHYLIG